MRVMVIVKASKESEAGVLPTTKSLTEMGAFNEELVKAGIMLSAEGLHPSSKGVRVTFNKGKQNVTNGPFTQTKELAAGFWLWQVKNMEEAVKWIKRMPQEDQNEHEVEIRPIFEADDFGDAYTPELRKQEQHQRAASKAQLKK